MDLLLFMYQNTREICVLIPYPETLLNSLISYLVFWNCLQYFVCIVFVFPGGASGKEPACQCRRCKKDKFSPQVMTIPCRRFQQPTPVFLLGESYEQGRLLGYSPQDQKESDITEVAQYTHMYSIVSSTNSDCFTYSFLICILFIYFFL